jgi:hypothetical protein
VSETLSGRQVQSYEVLVRIAEGLGVSRGAMGLAYAGDDEGPMLFDDVTEDMRRRAVLAAATTALFGALILGEVLELPERPNIPTPLLANLAQADIDAIDRLTRALESEARYYGGGAAVISPAARRAERLLKVPAAEALRPALMVGLADLHNVAA